MPDVPCVLREVVEAGVPGGVPEGGSGAWAAEVGAGAEGADRERSLAAGRCAWWGAGVAGATGGAATEATTSVAGRAIAATTSVPRGGTLATTSSAAAVGGRGSRAAATGEERLRRGRDGRGDRLRDRRVTGRRPAATVG